MIAKAIVVIQALVVIALLSWTRTPASTHNSARDVLEQFCELDAQGKQLTPDGWKEVAALFTAPTEVRRDKLIVVRDFVVSQPTLRENRAEFYVEYINLGQLDRSLRFSRLPPVKVRAGFDLLLIDKYGSDGTRKQVTETARWRINGTPPEPHLTVEAAIHYVAELRSKAENDATKKNANKTIAALKSLAIH